ncbi:hypothetical protein PO909_005555 [Leuciscus waleckii]
MRLLEQAVESLGLEWSTPQQPALNRLDGCFLQRDRTSQPSRPAPFLPELHEEVAKSWSAPFSARVRAPVSAAFSVVAGAKDKGYHSLPPVEEAVAAHLCPPSARRRAKTALPSKSCRTTSALHGRAYTAAGQAVSALHSMVILQVFQANLLRKMEEEGPQAVSLPDLRSATELALRATKSAAQAMGRNMASLTVAERHLWLTLSEMSDSERSAFLDAPVSPAGLFGSSVKDFADRFTEVQKTSQAMKHFLPKRSSSAAGRSKQPSARSSQPQPSAAAAPQRRQTRDQRPRSRSAGRRPPPRGPRLKIEVKPFRSLSSSNCDCSSVFCSKQVGSTARLPAHKRRFYGDPDKSQKECIFWYSGHGRWCYECSKNAQCPFLHTDTARHTRPAQIKSTHVGCAPNVVIVPMSQCPQTLHATCLTVSVKTKPTHIQSAQTDGVLSVMDGPVVPRPHSLTDILNPTGLTTLALSQHTAAGELSAGRLPAVISVPPVSHAANAALMLQHTVALRSPLGRDQSPDIILPLATHAKAWAELPGVSEWVLNIIERGYSLQFGRRPQRKAARIDTTVKKEVAHLLRAEIAKLLSKGAIEPLSQAQSEGGMYSRYFLVPKKYGGLRPILDLRRLNKALLVQVILRWERLLC